MKKIVLSVASLFFFSVLSTGSVNAESNDGQSMAKETQTIMPYATPKVVEVTLENGEEYNQITQVMPITGMHLYVSYRIDALSGEKEAFKISNGFNQLFWSFTRYAVSDSVSMSSQREDSKTAHFQLTNYSPGAVTYKISTTISYRPV